MADVQCWNSFWKMNKTDRSLQMSKQEALIEQKKREIEQKLAEKKRKEAEETSKKWTGNKAKKVESEGAKPRISNITTVLNAKAPAVKDTGVKGTGFNAFTNDGSFLEQFRKMQNMKDTKTAINISLLPQSVNDLCNPEKNENSSSASSNVTGICMKLQTQKNTSFAGLLSSSTIPAAFFDIEEVKVSPPEDAHVKLLVDNLAFNVATDGPGVEETARQEYQSIAAYQFLYDQNCETYKYFQQKVTEIQRAKRKTDKLNESGDSNGQLSDSDNSSSGPKKRKSRWGPGPQDVAAVSPVGINPAFCSAAFIASSPGLVAYALKVFGTTDLTPTQWSQLEEQMKMRILVEYLMVKKRESEKLAEAGKVKYEYDSDEDVEGGTWEHKRRMEEMEKTKAYADMLTEMGRGKHHIGDFLPPDELAKFMEKYEAIKAGRDPDLTDYKEFKLTEDNIGYKMLQKLGWKEGMGLGADGSGITAPINKATPPVENAGFGQGRPDEVKKGDDEYDAYRKRMMLAYRFRPNPLNNPRRPYY